MKRLALVLACCVPWIPATAAALPPWTDVGVVAPGRQFAAVADDASIHIIAEAYVQIDSSGAVLRSEAETADGRQSVLDLYPAIAVGADDTVHAVTRHGGSYEAGHQLRYASRAADGGWSTPVNIGPPVARNYTVGVTVLDSGRVLVSHGRLLNDVSSVIDLYAVENDVATPLGTTPTGWLRADADHRLRSVGNRVFLASGTPGPGPTDPVHLAVAADGTGDVMAQWQASHRGLVGGAPRRGGPSLAFDDAGRVWVGYGAATSLHVERFAADGSSRSGPAQTHDALGSYHLGYGNGAIAVSPDGTRVVAVALRNADNDEDAADCELLVAESVDGGASFGAAVSTGFEADGGDGRMRPRLLEVDGQLVLLYRDDARGGIAAATTAWLEPDPEPEPGGSTGGGESTADPSTTAEASGGETASLPPPSGSTSGADSSGTSSAPLNPGFPGQRGDSGEGCACRAEPRDRRGDWTALLWWVGALALRRRRYPARGRNTERTDPRRPPHQPTNT